MSPRRGSRGTTRLSRYGRTFVIIGVVVFLLVDIVLVAIAVASTHPGPAARPGPVPTFTSTPFVPSPSPTPTTTATPAGTPTAASATSAPGFLSAISSTEAWRSSAGTCPSTTAVLEHTTDGGASWQTVSMGQYAVYRVLSLDGGPARTSVVGLTGSNCAVGLVSTFTGGQFWSSYPADLDTESYIDPSGSKELDVQGSVLAAPCDTPIQVATEGSVTAALCPDALSEKSGQGAWVTTPVPGARALATSASGYTLAVAGSPGCAGVAIETLPSPLNDDAQPARVGCATSVANPESVAVSLAGQSLWLWSGSDVLVSSDAGASWVS